MAVVYLQPEGGQSRQGGSGTQFTVVKKGNYADLKTEAEALDDYETDTTAPGGKTKLVSYNLAHLPAGKGKLTIVKQHMGKKESVPGSEDPEVDAIRYKISNVQTSVSILRYCGPSQGANAYAHDILLWREERNKDFYDNYQYKLDDGGIVTLSDASVKLAQKYQAGIEEVMRFYPVVQRITRYAAGTDPDKISGVAERLAHIDTPPKMSSLAPSWLKIQDEIDIDEADIVTRTEGWQGAEHFDVNLYGDGAERWEFGTV